MSQTIYECLKNSGYDHKRHTGDVGVEIETETKEPYVHPSMKFWSPHRDGSLRDFGMEYTHIVPVSRGRELRASLEEFRDKIVKKFPLIKDSFSTSTHVHINFLNDKWVDLANFITTYLLVENLLIRYSGPDRLSNLFCLPMCDAEAELEAHQQLFKSIQNLQFRKMAPSPDSYKYSALNICNITKLGTMEIRSMRGLTDIDEIETWVNILLSLKDFAKTDNFTPQSILQMYKDQGPRITRQIFGDYYRLFEFPDKEALINRNLWYSANATRFCKIVDDKWGFPKPKKVYREHMLVELDKLSQENFGENYGNLPFIHKITIDEKYARVMNIDPMRVIFEKEDL